MQQRIEKRDCRTIIQRKTSSRRFGYRQREPGHLRQCRQRMVRKNHRIRTAITIIDLFDKEETALICMKF